MGNGSSFEKDNGHATDQNLVHNINSVRPIVETKNTSNREGCNMTSSDGFEKISANNSNNNFFSYKSQSN